MDDDRLTNVERGIAELQTETQAKFDQILISIAHLSKSILKNPTEDPPPTIPQVPLSLTADSHPRQRTARPAAPPDFDGDRSKGRAFLNSCQTYIRLCPKEFLDEQTKIVWAMSYMKSGRAQKWTERIFRWEQQPENAGSARYIDWEDFRNEFQKEFTPAHADALAVNRLETAAYYQKSRSLDEYIDEFQDLVTEAGYTDSKTIVVKFRRGLNPQIQNAVATMASGRPSDVIPSEWYSTARTVDQNRAANEAFTSAYRGFAPAARPVGVSLIRPTPTPATRGNAHLIPTPGNPVPMDLDVARRKALEALRCFRCKKQGHFGKDCPDRFDIRMMTLEEMEEALENRMAQLDAVPADPVPSSEEALANPEDFQQSDE
jgi:hypothetical protein